MDLFLAGSTHTLSLYQSTSDLSLALPLSYQLRNIDCFKNQVFLLTEKNILVTVTQILLPEKRKVDTHTHLLAHPHDITHIATGLSSNHRPALYAIDNAHNILELPLNGHDQLAISLPLPAPLALSAPQPLITFFQRHTCWFFVTPTHLHIRDAAFAPMLSIRFPFKDHVKLATLHHTLLYCVTSTEVLAFDIIHQSTRYVCAAPAAPTDIAISNTDDMLYIAQGKPEILKISLRNSHTTILSIPNVCHSIHLTYNDTRMFELPVIAAVPKTKMQRALFLLTEHATSVCCPNRATTRWYPSTYPVFLCPTMTDPFHPAFIVVNNVAIPLSASCIYVVHKSSSLELVNLHPTAAFNVLARYSSENTLPPLPS